MGVGRKAMRFSSAFASLVPALFVFAIIGGCSQLGVDPDEPAAIELTALPSPSVVVGDTLRNADGVATPLAAIVRNIRGEVITGAPITYVYAEYNRDSALIVDPETGYVVAVKPTTGEARIAARVGSALQVLRPILVTLRPDSMDVTGQLVPTQLTTTLPDETPASARSNTSVGLNVVVRHIEDEETTSPVRGWIVQYTLVQPQNALNDTTAAVFLVNDAGRGSTIDTTDAAGVASRFVRVRAAQFPASAEPDSVIVDVTAQYRGTVLRGGPIRLVLPVLRGTPAASTRTR